MAKTETIRLVRLTDAAEQLGVTVACIRGWIQRRKVEYVKLGFSVRLKNTTVQDLIDRGTIPALDGWEIGTSEGSEAQSKLVPLAEAASRMGVSQNRLRRWIGYRKIEVVRVGGRIMVSEEAIQHVNEHGMPERPRSKS